jgi:aryl-alcohol dehydrogenase-like predicted oxidoreductase
MQYKRLGNTGILVSEICLGTMTFGGKGFWSAIGQTDRETAGQILRKSLDAGVNFIDTANVYSEGQAEEILGYALKDTGVRRDSIIIATKVKGRTGPGPNDEGLSRQHIFAQVHASLSRLQTDYIDLYQIHGYDPYTPLEETMEALNDLVRSGLVRYTGCSNLSAWQIMKARAISSQRGLAAFESVQSYYTIAGRDLEREIIPLLEDQRMGLMVWSPLAGGLLSGKFKRDSAGPEGARRSSFDFPPVNMERAYPVLDALESVSRDKGISVARLALAWLLGKPAVTSVIVGAKNVEQLSDNLEAVSVQLTPEEWKKLDDASALPPEYPGWMFAFQDSRDARKDFLKKT